MKPFSLLFHHLSFDLAYGSWTFKPLAPVAQSLKLHCAKVQSLLISLFVMNTTKPDPPSEFEVVLLCL